MAVASDYTIGTITLTNGSVNFTGTGTSWRIAGFQEGDSIFVDNSVVIIDRNSPTDPLIESDTSGKLTSAWLGASGTRNYRMRYTADGERVTAKAQELIESLANGMLGSIADLTPVANTAIGFDSSGDSSLFALTAFMQGLLGKVDGPAVYSALGEVPNDQFPEELRTQGVTTSDLNTFIDISGWGKHVAGTANAPSTQAGYIFNLSYGTPGYNKQIWYSRLSNLQFTREQNAGAWGNWSPVWMGSNLITDCNAFINNSGWGFVSGASSTNLPIPFAGIVQNFYTAAGFNRQIYYQRDGNRQFQRNMASSVWSSWEEIGGGNLAQNGWVKFPSGLIIQWGSTAVTTSAATLAVIDLPIAFPNTCFVALAINGDWSVATARTSPWVAYAKSTTQITFGTNVVSTAVRTNFIALGN